MKHMNNKSIIIQGQLLTHEEVSTLDNNISDVSEPIEIQNNDGSSQSVSNVSPQRLQELDYVQYAIGKQL